jgi:uncharacterized integral membrane protein (TIGR00698 family)
MPATGGLARLLPGLALAATVALLAVLLRRVPVLATTSALMLAILLGMAWRNLAGTPAAAMPGLIACLRRPLRVGIALLGLQLTLTQVSEVGVGGVALLVACVAASFVFTVGAGRWLGVEPGLARLIAAGTSICGASAIVAANTVVRDSDESVAYSLAVVTLCGTVVMLLFPLLGGALQMSDHWYGLWIGASVHEVAQVVAAGFAHGQEAGEFATVSKLTRVLMLAPLVLLLAALARRSAGTAAAAGKAPTPWFVYGFIALVLLASSGAVPDPLVDASRLASQSLLALALAAVGLCTDLRSIVARGWRPFALGGLASAFIGLLALLLVFSLGALPGAAP